MSSMEYSLASCSFSIVLDRVVVRPPFGKFEAKVDYQKLGDLTEGIVSLLVRCEANHIFLVVVLLDLIE